MHPSNRQRVKWPSGLIAGMWGRPPWGVLNTFYGHLCLCWDLVIIRLVPPSWVHTGDEGAAMQVLTTFSSPYSPTTHTVYKLPPWPYSALSVSTTRHTASSSSSVKPAHRDSKLPQQLSSLSSCSKSVITFQSTGYLKSLNKLIYTGTLQFR